MRPEQQNGTLQNRNLVVVCQARKASKRVWGEQTGDANTKRRILGGSVSETGGRRHVLGPQRLVRQIDYPQNWTFISISVTAEKGNAVSAALIFRDRELLRILCGNDAIMEYMESMDR